MNKTQTKRLQKFIHTLQNTGLATRDTYESYLTGERDLYVSRFEDEKRRPTIGALVAKCDRYVAQNGLLSNVGRVAYFLEGLGLGNSVDLYEAAERIVIASAGTHSPVQNSKRALAALNRFIKAEGVSL